MPHINKFVEKAKLSAKEKLINEIENNSHINKYPPFLGLPILKKKIVEMIKKDHYLSLTNDQVIITAGAMEGLHGEEVILLTPFSN